MRYLLDTHIWIWWVARSQSLSENVRAILVEPNPDDELFLSIISVWEVCKLHQEGKISFALNIGDWIEEATDVPGLYIVPLSTKTAYHSTILPGAFHDDPTDQIIVATARDEGAVILTKDERIRAYPHVRSIW